MSPRHHPGEETLLAHAVGTLPPGGALVVALHLEACPHCRATMRFLDTLGGVLMASLEPEAVDPDALGRALAALEHDGDVQEPPVVRGDWSNLVEGLRHGEWQTLGPSLEVAAIEGEFGADESVCFLRAKAGAKIPRHGHEGAERFVVLEGGFGVGKTVYLTRDYVEAGPEDVHTPFIPADSDCLCLFALQGALVFTDPSDRLAGA